MNKIRVLIVDDHAVFLEGLYTLIRLEDDEIDVVGTALNGSEALEKEEKLRPDVVLLDIKMPVMDGVEVARRMKARRPELRILMLTTFDDRDLIRGAISAGANGYLLKDAHAAEVIQGIKSIVQGNVLISSDLAMKLSSDGDGETDVPAVSEVDGLSNREIEVLKLMSQGKTNSEISDELFISEKTVRNYVSRIYDTLHIHSRTRAAVWAIENLAMRQTDDT